MEEQEGKKTYKKNDIIYEETSEGENPDYVVPTVNDAEGISLTIPVGIQEGVTKNIKIRMIEQTRKKMTANQQNLIAPQ